MNIRTTALTLISVATLVGMAGCSSVQSDHRQKIEELQTTIAEYQAREDLVEKNLAVMRQADEAWNARDWAIFDQLHSEDVVVPSPHNPEGSQGIKAHSEEMQAFIHAFPDHQIQLPYKVTFGSGDWIVAVHENGGTFKNEWVFPNGYKIPPTGKTFTMTMATIGQVKDGQLEYELLIFDQGAMMNQLGVNP